MIFHSRAEGGFTVVGMWDCHTIDASGLRTGTVYGDSGQVLASGELKPETLADGSVGRIKGVGSL
jgi:hypothetical protein